MQVHIGTVIWSMPADRNDEMERREDDARLAIRIGEGDGDDENTLVNNRNTAMAVPHSLSFYTIFYKMTIENG